MTNTVTNQPKRRGRPNKPPEQHVKPFNLSLSPKEREKLEQLGGGDWIRTQIKEAQV